MVAHLPHMTQPIVSSVLCSIWQVYHFPHPDEAMLSATVKFCLCLALFLLFPTWRILIFLNMITMITNRKGNLHLHQNAALTKKATKSL